jgi:hypothetical protein
MGMRPRRELAFHASPICLHFYVATEGRWNEREFPQRGEGSIVAGPRSHEQRPGRERTTHTHHIYTHVRTGGSGG